METLGKDVTLVSLLLTMNIFRTFSRAFITNFDQVNVYWVEILLGQKCLGKNVAYDWEGFGQYISLSDIWILVTYQYFRQGLRTNLTFINIMSYIKEIKISKFWLNSIKCKEIKKKIEYRQWVLWILTRYQYLEVLPNNQGKNDRWNLNLLVKSISWNFSKYKPFFFFFFCNSSIWKVIAIEVESKMTMVWNLSNRTIMTKEKNSTTSENPYNYV